jgi:hypothetical protein
MAITSEVADKAAEDVASMFESDRVKPEHARDYGFGVMRALVSALRVYHVSHCDNQQCQECRIIATMESVKSVTDAIIRSGL